MRVWNSLQKPTKNKEVLSKNLFKNKKNPDSQWKLTFLTKEGGGVGVYIDSYEDFSIFIEVFINFA